MPMQSLVFRLRTSIFGALLMVAGFLLPTITHATITPTMEGCYQRSGSGTQFTFQLYTPTCEVVLTSDSSSLQTVNITMQNLDPHFYAITVNGEEITWEQEDASISFSTQVSSALSATISVAPWEDTSTMTDYWFAAGSDPQSQPGGSSPNPVFEHFAEYIAQLSPPFFTISGDMVGGSVDSTDTHEFYYEVTDDLLRSLPLTIAAVPGDHDARQSIADYYERYFGPSQYTFTYADTYFVAFNTTETLETEGEISDETFEWLEDQLAAAPTERIVVLMGHPIVPPTGAGSTGIDTEYREPLAELFVQYGVDIILTGDAHWYDDSIIDEHDFPGLDGSFQQLIIGGLGGKLLTYTGEHFVVLMHVTPDGIEHQRIDYSDSDIELQEEGSNDGTEESVTVTLTNGANITIPFVRAKFHVQTDDQMYAVSDTGEVWGVTSHTFPDDTQRGFVQLELSPEDTTTVTMGPVSTVYTGVENVVAPSGAITFTTLPTSTNSATDIMVNSSSAAARITVDAWDVEQGVRQWTSRSASRVELSYTIDDLEPYHQYNLFVNDTLRQRRVANANGEITVISDGKATTRHYVLQPTAQVVSPEWGALPASSGGANFRSYDADNSLTTLFFAFSEDITHGFASRWIDVDGENSLELVIHPRAGRVQQFRLYDHDGDLLTLWHPFGRSFTGDAEVVTADLVGQGQQYILASATTTHGATVKVYRYNTETAAIKHLKTIRPYGKSYRGNILLTAHDVSGNGRAELVVASHSHAKALKAYRWKTDSKRFKLLDGKRLLSSVDALSSGDYDADGRAEISLAINRDVQIYDYAPAKQRLKIKRQFQPTPRIQDMTLTSGQLTKMVSEELVVAPVSGNGSVQVYGLNTNDRWKKLAGRYPFGKDFTGGFNLTVINRDQTVRSQLVAAKQSVGGKVRVLRLINEHLKNAGALSPYGTNFLGGIELTD